MCDDSLSLTLLVASAGRCSDTGVSIRSVMLAAHTVCCRLAISHMEDQRHQRTMADCLASWRLQTTARRELRQLEAVAARQTRLYMMKRLFGIWVDAHQQQQAELAAAKQEMLQRRAARVLQHWKVRLWPCPPLLCLWCCNHVRPRRVFGTSAES